MAENRLATNLRLLLILEKIAEANSAISPTDVSRKLNLPKQTVHRLCATLLEEGFVVREHPGKKLRPARRLRELASGLLQSSQHHMIRRQVLEMTARQVKETVNFVMPEATGMSYKDRVETDWAFRVQLPVGTNVPFHCTASGKCFLASLRKGERERMVQSLDLEKLTPNTHTDPETLLAELKLIAKQGYSLDNEEFMEGMVAMAVPVRDHRGRFFAALALHGPSMRLSLETITEKREALVTGAEQLSAILFEDETEPA